MELDQILKGHFGDSTGVGQVKNTRKRESYGLKGAVITYSQKVRLLGLPVS